MNWKACAVGLTAAVLCAAFASASTVSPRERLKLRTDLSARVSSADVAIFGDSIAFQAGPGELCGMKVFNAAIPGNGIDDLLAAAPAMARRMSPHTVVVAIGANDARRPHAPLAVFETKYRTLLQSLAPARLILVQINPVDGTRNAFSALYDTAFIPQQNAVIRSLAAEFNARVVPAPRATPTRDGVHPTAAGGDLWRARLMRTACATPAAETTPLHRTAQR